MANEKKTDILIARLLREAGIDAEPNGSRIKEVQIKTCMVVTVILCK